MEAALRAKLELHKHEWDLVVQQGWSNINSWYNLILERDNHKDTLFFVDRGPIATYRVDPHMQECHYPWSPLPTTNIQ